MTNTRTTEQAAIDNLIMKLAAISDAASNHQRLDNAKALGAAFSGMIEALGDDFADEFGLDNSRDFSSINEPIKEAIEIMFNDIKSDIETRSDFPRVDANAEHRLTNNQMMIGGAS